MLKVSVSGIILDLAIGYNVTMSNQNKELEQSLVRLHDLLETRWLSPAKVFSAADENGDGHITSDEFMVFLSTLGISAWSEQENKEIFDHFDESDDGQIDLKEFEDKMLQISQVAKKKVTYDKAAPIPVDESTRFVSLVAHNEMKSVLLKFVEEQHDFFSQVPLVTTGSTGKSLEQRLGIPVEKLVASGPLGGDQAIGGMISENRISAIFFFKDPLSSHAHAADIEALTRLCDVHQIPYATNRSSAIGLLMALKKFGLNWQMESDENSIVNKYKQGQSQVIAAVGQNK